MKRAVLGCLVSITMVITVTVAGAAAAPETSHSVPTTTADLVDLTATFIHYKIHFKEMLSTDRVTFGRVRALHGLVRADIAYNAVDHREWALANFKLVLPASMKAEISFQDGGSYGIFNKIGAGKWFMIGEPGIPLCAKEFPSVIARLWGLDNYATCS
jgi:hypothetical protein